MKQKSSFFIVTLSLISILSLTSAFGINEIQHDVNHLSIVQRDILTDQCKNASIYEYLKNFALPLKDVEKLLGNQFSRNSISDFDASNKVKLFNIISTSKLVSSDQSESYASPFKATVFNNQIQFTFTYKLNITEGTLKKTHTFDAVTKISNVSMNYEKEFKLDTGVFSINSATVKIDSNAITSTFKPDASDAEQKSFDVAIKGTSPSLLSEFSKIFSNDIAKSSMQSNVKGDHLSKVYAENPYKYQFYNTNINIDISTVSYTNKDTSLTTGMSGKFNQGNTFCSQFVPDFTDTGASLYFTKEFIQNFIQYNIATYPGWKNVKVDRTTVRTKMLQWQLLDLDFIVDGLWNDLTDFYQNEIRFQCDIQDQVSTNFQLQNSTIYQVLAWNCKGFVKLNSTAEWKVMDFTPRINHKTELKINSGSLTVLVNALEMIDCQFNDVASLNGQGKYTVGQDGAKVAWKYIQSTFNDFRTYPIGNWFKVNSNANTIQVEAAGNGIWII